MNIIEQIQRAMLNGGEVPSSSAVALQPMLSAVLSERGEVPSSSAVALPVPVEQSRPVAQPRPVAQSSGSGISSEGVPQFTVKNIAQHSDPVVRLQESRGLLSDNPNSYGSNDELETAMQQTKGSPTGAVLRGVNYGTNTATGQNEKGLMDGFMGGVSSLLGNIDIDRLIRVMGNPAFQQGSMGQEANVGQNLIRRLVESNYNVSQEDALAAQTGQANRLNAFKAETARIKEQGTTSPKFTSEIIKLYKQNESYGQSLNAIANAKKYINDAYAGAGGNAKGALVGIARFFGSDIKITDNEKIEDAANRVKAAIIGSGMFGRDTSSKELKLLDKLVLQISTLTSKDQVLNSFEQLTKSFQSSMQLNSNLLRAANFPSRSNISQGNGLISKREPLSGGS